MSAQIFMGGLWAVLAGTAATVLHRKRPVRCMRNLQSPCLQGFTLSR